MKNMCKDILVTGFALFSMFFGAGNVIFPPYLGLEAGSQWFWGVACYYLADIGLALVTLFAALKRGSALALFERIGTIPSALLMSVIILCIGPLVAIPRTAASTFEIALLPLAPGFSPVLFSVLFFLLVLLLCVQENAVIDIVGKVLTPALLLGLLIMIIKGVLSPIGPIPDIPRVENVLATGIAAGYQTMDVLAAAVFGIIVLKHAEDKGYTDHRAKLRVVAGAGILAGAALLIVYLGLTYLGVTTSGYFDDLSVDHTVLVVSIVRLLLGDAGLIIFAIVVALACITTAVALVSCSAAYFSDLSGGRLPYSLLVVVNCMFSAVLSNVGLEQIVAIASPILSIVYPPTLVLTLLAFFSDRIKNDWVFRLAALGALLTSLFTVLCTHTSLTVPLLKNLPFASLGFGWVLPAAIGAIAGLCLPLKK